MAKVLLRDIFKNELGKDFDEYWRAKELALQKAKKPLEKEKLLATAKPASKRTHSEAEAETETQKEVQSGPEREVKRSKQIEEDGEEVINTKTDK